METVQGAITDADREAIVASARDYIESWLDGDAPRMARCLHPELAKRSVKPDGASGCMVENLTRKEMVDATAEGRGTRYERPYDISILDAFGDIASVRVFSSVYMDFLHVARCGDRWLLLNVLWQRRQ
jgi:hypothetical protein